jgi:hypothetical protein
LVNFDLGEYVKKMKFGRAFYTDRDRIVEYLEKAVRRDKLSQRSNSAVPVTGISTDTTAHTPTYKEVQKQFDALFPTLENSKQEMTKLLRNGQKPQA